MDSVRVGSRFGALALVGCAAVAFLAAAGEPVVTCEVRDDPRGRVYRLEQREAQGDRIWTLSMRELDGEWTHLALPLAQPEFAADTVSLRFRNANGGRQIELDVAPAGSRLDVYVDYGLDVNIEPDLDPDVDHMNTGGAISALDCTIARP